MEIDDDLSHAVRLEFLALLHSERAAGVERPLAEYLALFPGREETVAEAFVAARRARESPPPHATDHDRLGPYRLERELGRGSQGAVWLAFDTRLERRVALKVVPRSPLFESIAPRFEREARVASKLDHPGLCAVLDFGHDASAAWIAMRFVEGETLAARIARGALDSLDARLERIERIARALHHAHESGVVHRDVKPANVMVTGDGTPVVLDFGVARSDDDGAPLTLTGDALGTPAYMAPEQLAGKATRVDRRADVWALGVTAFELLTGKRPFEAPTREELARRIVSTDAPGVRTIDPGLPREVEVVLATALEPDVERRYASALDFAEDLRRVREHEPIRARPASAALRARRWTQRNPRLAASLGALVFVLASALAVATVLLERTRSALNRRDALLRDVTQLTDQTIANDLLARERELWPAREERLAEFDEWIDASEAVLARRGQHERTRETLATRTDLDPDPQRNAAARAWLGEQLDRLVESLGELEQRVPHVRARREQAATMRRRSIDDAADRWRAAIEAVSSDARFAGLALTPQVGLVPLGADPRSGLQEFAVLDTGVPPTRDAASGELHIDGESAIVLVLIPGGEFELGARAPDAEHPLGSPNVDPWIARWDGPPVRVRLEPYFLAKHELTQAQWIRHARVNPAVYQGEGRLIDPNDPLRHPVEGVSWIDADQWLRELALELPTEAR